METQRAIIELPAYVGDNRFKNWAKHLTGIDTQVQMAMPTKAPGCSWAARTNSQLVPMSCCTGNMAL